MKEELIKEFHQKTNGKYITYEGQELNDLFTNWLIEHHEKELAKKDAEIEQLQSAHDKLKARVEGAPKLYMPEHQVEYAFTKRFPAIDFYADAKTCMTEDGNVVKVALVELPEEMEKL